jgi:hypothetical protein
VAVVGIGGADGANTKCHHGGAKHDLHGLSPISGLAFGGGSCLCIASSAIAER